VSQIPVFGEAGRCQFRYRKTYMAARMPISRTLLGSPAPGASGARSHGPPGPTAARVRQQPAGGGRNCGLQDPSGSHFGGCSRQYGFQKATVVSTAGRSRIQAAAGPGGARLRVPEDPGVWRPSKVRDIWKMCIFPLRLDPLWPQLHAATCECTAAPWCVQGGVHDGRDFMLDARLAGPMLFCVVLVLYFVVFRMCIVFVFRGRCIF
jgi:hypothetical protein